MGRSIAFSELQARTLRAADMQRQVTQGYAVLDLPDVVNESVASLYDLITSAYEDYFVASTTYTVPPRSAPDVALPADFYKALSVQSGLPASPTTMMPISEAKRPYAIADVDCDGYQLNGNNIMLLTSSDPTVTLRYVPQAPYLVNPGDTISMAIVPGWESYIVYDAAASLVQKGDRDGTALLAKRDRISQRIQLLAGTRDAGRPHQMQDVYAFSTLDDY